MNKIAIALAGTALLVGLSICLTGAAHLDAGTNVAPDHLKQLCENIVTQVGSGDKKGFALVAAHRINPAKTAQDRERENFEAQALVRDAVEFQEKCGVFLGCEYVEEKNLSSSLCRYTYLAKYEENAALWTFVFYRPHDEWKILWMKWTALASDPLP